MNSDEILEHESGVSDPDRSGISGSGLIRTVQAELTSNKPEGRQRNARHGSAGNL